MKRTSKAPWIVGIVLLAIAIFFLLIGFGVGDEQTKIGAMIIALFLFVPSLILFIVSIISSNNAQRSNEVYLRRNQGKVFVASCFHCGHTIELTAENFSIHRNYPEGFAYCPVCHKPLSKRAFRVMNDGWGTPPPDHYEYYYDE